MASGGLMEHVGQIKQVLGIEAGLAAPAAMKQAAEIMDLAAAGRGLPALVAALMGALGLQ
jgi:hypothetical protein